MRAAPLARPSTRPSARKANSLAVTVRHPPRPPPRPHRRSPRSVATTAPRVNLGAGVVTHGAGTRRPSPGTHGKAVDGRLRPPVVTPDAAPDLDSLGPDRSSKGT